MTVAIYLTSCLIGGGVLAYVRRGYYGPFWRSLAPGSVGE